MLGRYIQKYISHVHCWRENTETSKQQSLSSGAFLTLLPEMYT